MIIKLYKNINEGVTWSKNDDGTVSLSIDQDRTDATNTGRNSVDTRIFGNKDDILYGDGTMDSRSKSLYQRAQCKKDTIKYYNDVIKFIDNGRKGEIKASENVSPRTISAVAKWFNEDRSDNYIKFAAQKAINKTETEYNIYKNTVDRISNANDDNKVARYMTGTVQGTNVPYISLFSMTDFNFSDAIKHGNIRQNGNTDDILGIEAENRLKSQSKISLDKINIKYDDDIDPDIKRNFSLSDDNKDHDKISYDLNDKKYTSISQFIDKSVQYAVYALRQEKFYPDYIVSAPSSSKFNTYYCRNLSKKLNVPYKENFYKTNLINVKFNGDKDFELMRKDGFSEKDILEFETQVKYVAYREISYIISTPIRTLIDNNKDLFGNISVSLHSREKVPLRDVFECLMIYVYKLIVKHITTSNDIVHKQLINNFKNISYKLFNKTYDSSHIIRQIIYIIKLKIGLKPFNKILVETYNITKQYSEQLKEKGYTLRFDSKKFKITSFKKQFRPYLHDVYIIADEYLNKDKNLTTQYKNAKFLIFDEDTNSGATLKLCINALQDKIPENKDKNIMCLVNAYSAKSW